MRSNDIDNSIIELNLKGHAREASTSKLANNCIKQGHAAIDRHAEVVFTSCYACEWIVAFQRRQCFEPLAIDFLEHHQIWFLSCDQIKKRFTVFVARKNVGMKDSNCACYLSGRCTCIDTLRSEPHRCDS